MSFTKLRIFVGIALVLFIFVAGNIIVLGKMTGKASVIDQTLTQVDPKKVLPQDIVADVKPAPEPPAPKAVDVPPPKPTPPPVVTAQPPVKPTPPPVETAPPPQPVQPVPVVVHRQRRTRAS